MKIPNAPHCQSVPPAKSRAVAVLACALALCACGRQPDAAPAATLFVEVAAERGLDFTHATGPRRTYHMPEIMGAGGALLDYDNDGDLDVYLVNGAAAPGTPAADPPPVNRLFRQEPGGAFADVTESSGLGDTGNGMGVAIGDYDNDGFVDVYVTNDGPNQLYRNRGDGRFSRVTERAGVGDPRWGTSATFLDFDADGWLDLYVANYLVLEPGVDCPDPSGRPDFCSVGRFPGDTDRLYRNNGDGTFEDVSEASGIADAAYAGLGVVAAELTGDGLIDIFVANDLAPNLLWINRGDGAFYDDAVLRGLAYNEAGQVEAGMGVVCADIDGDARLDLFLTHLEGETNTLYRADSGMFEDATARSDLVTPSTRGTGFGVLALDVEHDGDLDLLVANGHVYRGAADPAAALGPFWNDYAQTSSVLRNDDGRFTDVSRAAGSFGAEPRVGRGLAAGDVDGDGDLDVLATSCHDRVRLFRNDSPLGGHWLVVRALDEELRRDALGARVTVSAGGRRQVRTIRANDSYLSASEARAHFGLADAARFDSIEVAWPGGPIERFDGGEADRAITVVRGRGGSP